MKRKIFIKLLEHIDQKAFTIIVGARQTGKTTLLEQLKEELIAMGKPTYFITLEDFRVLNELNHHPENLFRFVQLPDQERVYVLMDEIQYLANPSNFLKLLFDKFANRLKLVATGSSAFYIDSKFTDSLAGRKRIFELYTLDFEEYLLFSGKAALIGELEAIRKDKDYISLSRNEIKRQFEDYLIYGGYPQAVLARTNEEKEEVLIELVNSFLYKDIMEAGVQQRDKFNKMLLLLAHQTGSLLNANELSNTLGLSGTAVNNYLTVLRKSFHISLVKPFYNNIRKELTKMPKVYFNDLGMRHAIMRQFGQVELRADRGQLIENYLYIRLRQLMGKERVRFWRTADGNEVDFIVEANGDFYAIEAKYNEVEFKEKKYKKFNGIYPDIPLVVRAYHAMANERDMMAL